MKHLLFILFLFLFPLVGNAQLFLDTTGSMKSFNVQRGQLVQYAVSWNDTNIKPAKMKAWNDMVSFGAKKVYVDSMNIVLMGYMNTFYPMSNPNHYISEDSIPVAGRGIVEQNKAFMIDTTEVMTVDRATQSIENILDEIDANNDTFYVFRMAYNTSLLAGNLKMMYVDSVLVSINGVDVRQDAKIKSDSVFFRSLITNITETDPVWQTDKLSYYTRTQSNALYQPVGTYLTSFTETDPLFNTKFSTKSTTDLSEGTNLYWTNTRGDARYPLLSGSYTNPTWISSIPYSKITSTPDLSGYLTTASVANKTDTSVTGSNLRRYVADSTAKAISLSTKLSSETQALSGSGNTVNLTGGSGYTIPPQAYSTITGKPVYDTVKFYSKSTLLSNKAVIVKDTFAISTANPVITLPLPTGTTIASVLAATGYRAGSTASNSPQVAIYDFTSTTVSLLVTQQNTTTVSILGINVLSGLPFILTPDPTNVKIVISYIAY